MPWCTCGVIRSITIGGLGIFNCPIGVLTGASLTSSAVSHQIEGRVNGAVEMDRWASREGNFKIHCLMHFWRLVNNPAKARRMTLTGSNRKVLLDWTAPLKMVGAVVQRLLT